MGDLLVVVVVVVVVAPSTLYKVLQLFVRFGMYGQLRICYC